MASIRSKLICTGLAAAVLIAGGGLLLSRQDGPTITAANQVPAPAPAKTFAPPITPATGNGKKTASKKTSSNLSWRALTPAQQLAFAPLAGEWDSMDAQRKEKWLAIGDKYARMSPAEQSRLQDRMRDWVKLTPEERRSVRRSYASTKKWDADEKSAQWQQYLQLSDEQKAQLAEQKFSQPPVTAVSRAKPKPPSLLPIVPDPKRATATTAVSVPPTAAIAALPSAVSPVATAPATPAAATVSSSGIAAPGAPSGPAANAPPVAGAPAAPQSNTK